MDYIFASGAIGAKSTNLFGETQYLSLLKADKGDYLKVLRDFGYGFDHVATYLDEVISNELIKTKSELLAITPDINVIRLWFLKYDLINIKLVLKNHLFVKTTNPSYEKAATINIHELKEALINHNFDKVLDINVELLKPISKLVNNKTLTSQELSIKVDEIVYNYLYQEVNKLKDQPFLDYLRRFIDMNNLIILFRAQNINLTSNLLKNSLVNNGNIKIDTFKDLYQKRDDEQKEVLKLYFSEKVLTALNEYFDNQNLSNLEQVLMQDILDNLVNYNYDTFKSGPMINYLLKKEFEIQNVRRLYFDKNVEISNLLKY